MVSSGFYVAGNSANISKQSVKNKHLLLSKKILLFIVVAILVAIIAIVGYCSTRVDVINNDNNVSIDPNQTRIETLNLLENSKGEFDEKSIVLSDTSRKAASQLADRLDAELRITKDGKFARLTLNGEKTIEDIYSDESNNDLMGMISPDFSAKISDVVENESSVRQTSKANYSISDTYYNRQTYLDYLNIGSTWNSYTGNNVKVAIIDTGIDADHSEFSGKISEYSYNASEDKIVKDYAIGNGNYDWSLIEDEVGHGTTVAGTIAAAFDGHGTVGIAPNVTLIVIKAECTPQGAFYRTSDLVFGLYYAIEQDATIVNMSFGGNMNAYQEAARLGRDSDVLMVAAAGNESTATLTYPAADENVIGVGALEENGWKLAEYSNYGENVDLVAPGTVYTTKLGGEYGVTSGTSLASPIVAGALALLKSNSNYKYYDNEQIKEILYASCYDLGDLGKDWYYGYGALDISALCMEEQGTVTFNMLTDELENTTQKFIRNHTLQNIPEPERLYAVFDGWYYDIQCTEEYNLYSDVFSGDLTLYANWVNEDDGVPYTYVTLDDGTIEIRSYTGRRRYISIPDMIEGKTVSSIGDFAFRNESKLRQVTLPSHLRNIGMNAFDGCSNVISIALPETVETIGDYAFVNMVRLSSINIPANGNLKQIGDYAFSGCGSLRSVDLPQKLAQINGSAFFGATALNNINVDKDNAKFSSYDGALFNGTKSTLVAYPAGRTKTYTIPEITSKIGNFAFAFTRLKNVDVNKITEIGYAAFQYSSLTTITLPDTLVSLGEATFMFNSYLLDVSLGNGLRTLSAYAFYGCQNLTSVNTPSAIMSIGESAFAGSGVNTVTFDSDATLGTIGYKAFYGCPISSLELPESLVQIGGSAFENCMLLSDVTFGESANLYYIGAYAFAQTLSLETITIPDTVNIIGAYAFKNSALEGSVTVSANVNSLGVGAFAACRNLTAINVDENNANYKSENGVVYSKDGAKVIAYPAGNGATSYAVKNGAIKVDDAAFYGAVNLISVTLPSGVTEIGEYAFYDCENVRSYSLPDTLANIEMQAFAQNYALQNISIPDEVIHIGQYAFFADDNLSTIGISDSSKLTRIGFGAFAYCGITSFRVPAGVSSMAQYAFVGCNKLTSVVFASGSKLEYIAAYQFDGCTGLTTVKFESGSKLTRILAHGFEGMTNLTTVDFGGAELIEIDNYAFRYCESITTLTVPSTLINIGRFAFYNCKNLKEITLPIGLEHIGRYAFHGTDNCNVYFESEALPLYLDEYWDNGVGGYYTGVSKVETTADGNYKVAVLTDGTRAVIEYLGESKNIDLTTVDFGGTIANIGGYAFYNKDITSVVLPSDIKQIQRYAFALNKNLESITIPAETNYIANSAFLSTGIKTITFAGNNVKIIEQYAFALNRNLKSVTIPSSVTRMGSYVFYNSGLETLTFENGSQLTEIPKAAFAGTKIRAVSIPSSVNVIEASAFRDNMNLYSVSLGTADNLKIYSNAFYNTGLASVNIPENVKYVGEYAFVGLTNLTAFTVDENNKNYSSVDGVLYNKTGDKIIAFPAGRTGTFTVPKTVENIGFGAFENSALSEIKFENDINLLTFGYRAFYNADNLVSITVPKSLVSIDYFAFAQCDNLSTINFEDGNKLKGIYEGAFYGCQNLKNITLPDSVIEVSDYAFYGCLSLRTLPFDKTSEIKGVYSYAFGYTGIDELTLPTTLIDIGDYAFSGLNITELTIPEDNKYDLTIGIGAFADCNKLESITLPFIGATFEDEEITWFGYIFGAGGYQANATYVPASLKTVTLTEDVTFIGYYAFSGLTTIETLDMPASVDTLYYGAFENTSVKYELANPVKLWGYLSSEWPYEMVKRPSSAANNGYFGKGISGNLEFFDGEDEFIGETYHITSIGAYTFSGCSSLTSITMPDSVKSINYSAFDECSGLMSIYYTGDIAGWCGISGLDNIMSYSRTLYIGGNKVEGELVIPDGVTSVGNSAFSYCSSLTSITIPEGVTSIGSSVFSYCSSLTSITIPESVTSIGSSAFSHCSSLMSITIPEGVTSIAYHMFFGCSNLASITIPDSVTWIGYHAFDSCSSLTSISVPDSVTSIGDFAFFNCSSLTSITIPDSVKRISDNVFNECMWITNITASISIINQIYKANLKNVVILSGDRIENAMFSGCSSLTSIAMSDSVTRIGDSAFYGCSSLTSIRIPDSVTSIGWRVFQNCSSLTNITIPDGVTSIGWYVFSGCSSLTSITIPDSVTSIGWRVFSNCSSLTSIIIPDGVTNIGDDTFQDCSSLTGITIPNGVTSINGRMFSGCSSLMSITFGKNSQLTSIGSYAFSYCSSLKSITIPDSVTSIGDYAFSGCSSLYEVINNSDLPIEIGSNTFGKVAQYAKVLINKDGSKTYKDGEFTYVDTVDGFRFGLANGKYTLYAYLGEEEEITLPENINGNSYEIYQFRGGRKVIVPSTFTNIGDDAFYNSSSLTSITIPNSVTSIGNRAFYECSRLIDIMFDENSQLSSIGSYAFQNCSSLTSIAIPDSVTSIGDYAFITCVSLTKFNFGENSQLTRVGNYAFWQCSSLTSITIPHSVTSIGDWVFFGCSSLTSITIPNSVTSIAYGAFGNCSGLKSIYYIGDIAGWCEISGLNYIMSSSRTLYIGGNKVEGDLVIPDGVTSIGSKAFYNCSGLTSITIPDSVTSIGSNAFDGSGITDIILGENSCFIWENNILFIGDYSSIIYVSPNKTEIILSESMTRISDYLFKDNDKLTKITIPNSVTSIGSEAFKDCSSLTSITIPDSVTSIGSYAFQGCSSLTSITIPAGVTSIGWFVFDGCSSLTSITIPDRVKSIGRYAFRGCSSLTSIAMSDSVTSIGDSAFKDCSSLTSIVIPASVTSIGSYAFSGCSGLTSIYYNGNVAGWCGISGLGTIMSSSRTLYIDNKKVEGDLAIPEGVTSIPPNAFSGCSDLTSVTIPDSVTSIGWYAFFGCNSLTSITLPFVGASKDASSGDNQVLGYIFGYTRDASTDSGATRQYSDYYYFIPTSLKSVIIKAGDIFSNAFYGCSSLTSITIPASVTSIGDSAFRGCSSLTSITIPAGVKSIGDSAFSGCSGLTSITIPDSVTSVGNYAFSGCRGLTSITISDSVTNIGEFAFNNCSGLTSITISDSVTSIGEFAFNNCSGLTSVTIGNGVTSIGNYAFSDCSGLTSVIIGNSVISIGESAFSGCSGLTSINVSDNSPNYSSVDGILYNKDKTQMVIVPKGIKGSITIPDSVTSIGYDAFYNCSSLMSITIPDSVTSIGSYAFYNCSSLMSITIPDGVMSIEDRAFRGCSGLASVTIGNGVTSIGDYAFSYCSALTSITIPDNVTSIGNHAFFSCNDLMSITVPGCVTSIGEDAFRDCYKLVEVYNKSSLNITVGSSDYGYVGYYAKDVYTEEYTSKLSTDENGYILYTDGENIMLLGHKGSETELALPEGITEINEYAFYENVKIAQITIPDSVISIGSWAFSGCNSLTSVTFGKNSKLENICFWAFSGCSSLTRITFGENSQLTSIGNFAFYKCSSLTGVMFGGNSNLESIGNSAFEGCSGIISITIPNSVTSIGNSAFEGCSGLTSITIPNNVTSIGFYAFSGCSSLTSVTFGENSKLESIGSYAFRGCSSLTSITIPAGVTSIGSDAFTGTAYYNDANNWESGCLYISNALIEVSNDAKFIRRDINCMVDGVIGACYKLKQAVVWGTKVGYYENPLSKTTNIETLVLVDLPSIYSKDGWRRTDIQLYYCWGNSVDSLPLTLKNVILSSDCEVMSTDYFEGITGVRIFVDKAKEDCPWDEQYKGWNNGNKVFYKGEWAQAIWRDASGEIIGVDYYTESEVIKPPVVQVPENGEERYRFIGWDIDGDGIADSLPATLLADIDARAVVIGEDARYLVEFIDKDGVTVISSYQSAYNEEVILPDDPTKTGYTFLGWKNYVIGMLITRDIRFYAEWEHIGGGHSYVESVISPTCTEQGYTLHTCSVCGETYTDNFVKAKGHIFGAWTIDVAPTCKQEGSRYRTCSVCEETETAELPRAGHNFTSYVTKDATCTETGEMTYECSVCHEKYTEIIPLSAHRYKKVTVSMSFIMRMIKEFLRLVFGYEGKGAYYYECEDCGAVMGADESTLVGTASVQSKCSHQAGEWETLIAPSCVDGIEVRKCALCEDTLEMRAIAATGEHAYGEWCEVNAPDCTNTGLKRRDCEYCDHYETDIIDALGHDHSEEWTTDLAPTCTEKGSKSHHCSRCDDKADVTEIAALGHKYGEWKLTTEPTYDIEGEETRVCSRCEKEETRSVPKLSKGPLTFKEKVAAISGKTGEERFNAIKDALSYYATLSEEEKMRASEDYEELVEAIDGYNEEVAAINDEHRNAVNDAVYAFAASMSVFAALLYILKKRLF